MTPILDPETFVRGRFVEEGIPPASVEIRDFPGEKIIIVRLAPELVERGVTLGNSLDRDLVANGFNGFITVRHSDSPLSQVSGTLKKGVLDPRATELINLLTARSRTSEIQPSLSYIRDTSENLSRAVTTRHHLIFGRRGAGKTALMVEIKRLVCERGDLAVWANMLTYRRSLVAQAFAGVGLRLCEQIHWFHTGDMAVIHSNGYVMILDRKKDLIVSGGENVSSLEVEKTLLAHPAVLEAAVIAVKDDTWGEAPKAVVVSKPGTAVTEAELIEFCRSSLAHYKCPKSVAFVETLPKTATGKVLRKELRKKFSTENVPVRSGA